LTGLLNSDSTDGLANLIMGRVLEKEGRFPDAVSYFHRAIYGQWKQDAEGNRRRARLELIDLLAQQKSKEELLAELLPIQDDAPRDLTTRTHLGELFLRAGSPSRAVGVFRGIVREAPANTAPYKGLGEAEFAQGDYRAAQKDFQSAIRIAPDDATSRHWLDLCNQLLQLDPTLRGLGAKERLERSRELVDLAQSSVSQCLDQNSAPELQDLLSKAAVTLKTPVNAGRESETAEANLDLAEQLWQARKKECKTPTPTDSPLALVLARVAR
jgi:tetratricopeptide (TPR) repeat protein